MGVGALVGTSGDADTPGVLGENTGNGEGIRGTTRSARGGVVGVNNNPADDAGQAVDGESCGVYGESAKGEGVRGVSHSSFGGVVGVNDGAGIGVKAVSKDGPGLAAFSTGNDGVHGETNAEGFVGGVTGVAVNANGVATGVLGRSSGSGPGVSGLAAKDSGVLGFHGDPRLNETTVGNDGAVAGVFGASDVGAGVVGYSRNRFVRCDRFRRPPGVGDQSSNRWRVQRKGPGERRHVSYRRYFHARRRLCGTFRHRWFVDDRTGFGGRNR